MKTNAEKFLSEMTKRDYEALYSIYKYRGLTMQQIFDLNYRNSENYKKEVGMHYFKRKFNKFIKYGVVEEEYSYDRNIPAIYFLTNAGVKVVREAFGFQNNVYAPNNKNKLLFRGYWTARELKVEPKFIPHQYNLNCFAIELAKKMNLNNYEYEDERHTSRFESIRPDGIFYTASRDFFLEMDMGTETNFQLCEKWNHYRTFFNSDSFFKKDKPITIFFIVANVKKVERRIATIKDSINRNFIDVVQDDFDICVGTAEMLYKIFDDMMIKDRNNGHIRNMELGTELNKHYGFKIAPGDSLKDYLSTNYMWYIRRNIGEKIQEFVVDDWTNDSINGIKRIMTFGRTINEYKKQTGRNVKYLCLCRSINDVLNNLEVFNPIINGEILFTTNDLLKNSNSFENAVRTLIGPDMSLCKFVNPEMTKFIRE